MNSRSYYGTWMLKWPLLAALATVAALIPARPLYAQGTQPQASPSSDAGTAESTSEPAGYAAPLPRGRKLVLTDGSFQIVREYQRQGDRVRYYSVERSAWEEIPASLVDWAATDKAGAETETSQKETLDRVHAAAVSDVAATIDTGSSLLVGSGVFLPDSPGFYVLDGQTVLGLAQLLAESRLDKGRAILKGISGMPLISTKRFIEVPGKRAKVRIQSTAPEFYFRTTDGRSPQLALVRADINGDKRQVTTAVIDMVGTTKYQQRELPMLSSEAAHGVQRLTISQKLEPGEYALLETTSEGLSSYVWDFGVDAPPGANSSKTTNTRPPAKPNTK